MLKHKIIALLTILTLAVSVAACGDDDDDNGENGNNQTANNNDPDPNNNDPDPNNNDPDPNNNDPDPDPNNVSPNNSDNTTALQLEDFFADQTTYDNKYFGFTCECEPESVGFGSTEECEEQAITPSDDISDLAACVQGVADDHPDAPASVQAFYDCQATNIAEADACHDGIDFDEELCSDDNSGAVNQCDQIAFGEAANQECVDELDEAGFAFMIGETEQDQGFEGAISAECFEAATERG